MCTIGFIKKFVLSVIILIAVSACGSGNDDSKSSTVSNVPEAPQTAGIESPPMPEVEQQKN